MTTDGYIQVPPDSTGKKVRGIVTRLVMSDGSEVDVQMQSMSIVDASGHLVSADTTYLHDEIQQLNDTMTRILQVLDEAFGYDTKQALTKRGGRHQTMIRRV